MPSDGAANPTDACLLHIPNKNVGAELVAEFKHTIGDMTITQERKLDIIARQIDDNFDAIERWVDRFYKECMCDCEGDV